MLCACISIVAFAAALAAAQPFVNAPLLPMYNYVAGDGCATVGATRLGQWVFTANADGVYGMNGSAPANIAAPFYDALPGVTQMFSIGDDGNITSLRLIAIAGPSIVAYSLSATTVWRSAMYTTLNATFDLITDSNSQPSYMYPAFVYNDGNWMMVLGSRNTSSTTAALPSVAFAFDPWELIPVWWTQLNSDTTNFAASADATFVYVLAQNRTFGYSTVKVQRLFIANGTLSDYVFDTTYSSLVHLGVGSNEQLALLSSSGYLKIVYTSNSSVLQSDSIPTCGTMPFRPLLVNTSWVFVCGSYFYVYDSVTGAQTASKYVTNNIRCGAAQETSNNLVFVAGADVYVWNSSGVNLLVSLPAPLKSSYSGYCSGASIGSRVPHDRSMHVSTVTIYVSFQAYYSGGYGNLLILNFASGAVVAQMAANTDPLGPAVVDASIGRVFVASTVGPILQGFDFVPIGGDAVSFASAPASQSSSGFLCIGLAYNATNRSSYFISDSALYTVDWMGNTAQLASMTAFIIGLQPTIVGQYFVFIDSYYDTLFVYNSATGALSSVAVCDPSNSFPPIVRGAEFIFACSGDNSYNSAAAQLVDLSASPLTAAFSFLPKSGDGYPPGLGGALVGDIFVLATTVSEMRGFDMSSESNISALWTATYSITNTSATGFYYLCSPPVAFSGFAYFTATAYTNVSGSMQLFRIVPSTGVYVSLTELPMNSDLALKQIVMKAGGLFGGGIMYVIGADNITAFSTDMTVRFNYKHKSGAIRTASGPLVLDGSGAVCFYSSNHFNVVNGLDGELAWSYNVSLTGPPCPTRTDNSSVYFTNGQAIVGAETLSGAVTSISSFLGDDIVSFAVAADANWTSVVGATSDGVVFANEVPH